MSRARYREYAPSLALRPYVDCYWTRDSGLVGESRILPDGCIDVVFELTSASSLLVGSMTVPLLVEDNGKSSWLGVRFRPGGASPFLRFPMRRLTDRRSDLASVWPEVSAWGERLGSAETHRSRIDTLNRGLERELERVGRPPVEPRIRQAVERLAEGDGAVPIQRLSGELGLSRQHLARLFERHVGVGVKFYCRVVRLQKLLRTLPFASPPPAWSALALDLGYFDQAHFITDFKKLTGFTPATFAGESSVRSERDTRSLAPSSWKPRRAR